MSYKVEHNGKSVELPNFTDLPVGLVRKARNLAQDEQMWFMLENLLDEKSLAVIDEMSISEFGTVMNEWTQGAPVGESLKSSKS